MKLLGLEVECMYNAIEEKKEIPKCCKYEPGELGLHCFENSVKEYKTICPYLALGRTRSTVMLTNEKGKTVSFDRYDGDLNLSPEDYLQKEKKWIDSWKNRIRKAG